MAAPEAPLLLLPCAEALLSSPELLGEADLPALLLGLPEALPEEQAEEQELWLPLLLLLPVMEPLRLLLRQAELDRVPEVE